METTRIHQIARQLREAHGARAPAEAAQNAIRLETQGATTQAKTWRRIEAALKEMNGPHVS